MKRQFALLFALTFMVSGMASMAEETVQNETAQTQAVHEERMEDEWTAPFEDGDWLSVPEWNAEVYLPTGWMLTEVTENGFVAAEAEGEASLTVTVEEFATDGEVETAPEGEETTEESESVELSAFEEYLLGLGREYEMTLMGEIETAVFSGEENVEVKFPMAGQLITMTFAPADESGIAGSALSIAETFYMYTPVEGDAAEEAAAE